MIEIVCYMGGTCGDLITAIIDRKDVIFNINKKTITHSPERTQLKKSNLFDSDSAKDQYIQDIGLMYNSIPSHDIEYHISRQHPFIGITVDDYDVALWAANRFKNIHRPHVWKEMQQVCGANSVEDYAQMMIAYSELIKLHTTRTVPLESIKNGCVVGHLEKTLNITVDTGAKSLYTNWLAMQNGVFLI
jgi:hypothetical protein